MALVNGLMYLRYNLKSLALYGQTQIAKKLAAKYAEPCAKYHKITDEHETAFES